MNRTPARRRPLRFALPGALLLAAGLALAGCSSGDQDAGGGSTTTEEVPQSRPDELSADQDRAEGEQAAGDTAASLARTDEADEEPGSAAAEPAIIQTGTMTVQSDDVAAARFDLAKVVDSFDGSIADERTTATSEGEVRLSRVELRIPSGDFDEAMTDLGKLGKVTASTRKAEDVTGEVIDTRARVRAQEQSLARVEVLFSRAEDIRDIVAIEAQLSRRQAELDSLKGQLAHLEDQTTFSTITVYLEPTPEKPRPVAAQDDDTAFVGGLKDGWQALSGLGAGLATVSGALLPFAVVALLLGVPASVVLRRRLGRNPLRRPTAQA